MTAKRLEGRNEDILDPDLPIIDAHHHLFDRPELRYLLPEYLEDVAAGHNVVGSVYMETTIFSREEGPAVLRPLGEVEFANGIAAMCASGKYGRRRLCAGIVGYADLRLGAEITPLLDACIATAPNRFRGIRQVTIDYPSMAPYRYFMNPPPRKILQDPHLPAALAEISKRGLILDVCVFYSQLDDIIRIADAFPDLQLVLNHLGFPIALDKSAADAALMFHQWRAALHQLAKRPNVKIKCGGMGVPYVGLGFDRQAEVCRSEQLAAAWSPYMLTAIEIFGTDRVMMESNFPPDGASAGYVPIWNALKRVVLGASAEEKAALFHATAIATYQLDIPADWLRPNVKSAVVEPKTALA